MHKNSENSTTGGVITTRRRIMALKAFGIGLLSGLFAVIFRLALEYSEDLRGELIDFVTSQSFIFQILPPLIFAAAIMAVVYFTIKVSPDAGGSGIPHLKGYLEGVSKFNPWRILLVKFFGGVVGIGSGLALGREGPTVQMGASIAKIAGDHLSPNRTEKKILVSVGAGAGLAAAFNAPMAGVFFVLEELHSSFHQIVLVTSFISCVTADIVCRLMMGRLPVFHVRITTLPELWMYPYFLLFGVMIGGLGLLFNKSLMASSDYVGNLTLKDKLRFGAALGLIMGSVALFLPKTVGTGTQLISNALSGTQMMAPLILFFVLRFVFTMASYATGSPGGIFAPLLLLGVLSGSVFGLAISGYGRGAHLDLAVWGVLGMAGFFSAVVRAPITGTILILEMTGAYDLLLPIMLVSIISYGIPELFRDKPIYEALLERDLHKRKVPT